MKLFDFRKLIFAIAFMFVFISVDSSNHSVKAETETSVETTIVDKGINIYEPPADYLSTEKSMSIMSTSGYTMQQGDIFTTSATSSNGLVGHSAIAVSSYYILHIPGPGKTTELLTFAQWKSRYSGSTNWVHRVSNSTVRNQAGAWAYTKYYSTGTSGVQNIKPGYRIDTYTGQFNPTYCSKIVWQL